MPITLETAMFFYGAALILSIAPGPDNIFVLTQSAVYGSKAGFATIAGLLTGVCMHTLAVALGVAALLKAVPAAFLGLKILGAAYLLYLAYLSFCSGSSKVDLKGNKFPGYGKLYRRGVIMSTCNPKLCLFFLALLPQFVDEARGHVFWQFICLGLLFISAAVVVFSIVAVLGGMAANWLNNSTRGQIIMNRLAGCVFIGLAGFLLFTE